MLLGYVEFLLLLFLPGLALLEIFKLGGSFSFVERLGLAFGLSMCADVLAMAFRTSGVLIGSQLMVGIYPGTLELMLGVSLLGFLAPIAVRRKLTVYVKPVRTDLYLLGLVVAQAVLVLAHFYEYPIFPQFQSADFVQHVGITESLQSGQRTFLPGGVLYYGVHMLMGSLLALSGGIALEATQYAMGILVVLSPLLVFLAVSSLARSVRVALLASLLYVGTGSIWFGSVFNAGLYANFYGILAMLLLLALVPLVLAKPKSPGVWVAFALAVANGYVSHYSFVTLFPALVALPVAFLVVERKVSWPSVAVPVVVIAPALAAAAAEPGLFSLLVQFATATGGASVQNDTLVSKSLSWWPVLRYIFVEITDDLSSVVTVVLAVLGGYVAIKGKNPLVWMILVWLLSILVVAPFAQGAWRFSYIALLPLVIIAAVGIDRLLPVKQERATVQRKKLRARYDYSRWKEVLVVVALLCLFVGSWSWNVVGGSITAGSGSNSIQHGILQSMQWMNTNLPPNSQVVSVTDSDYGYYQVIFNKPAGYGPLATPAEIAASASAIPGGAQIYVVLTVVGTVGAVNASSNPFTQYATDIEFTQVYNESGVAIYKLVG